MWTAAAALGLGSLLLYWSIPYLAPRVLSWAFPNVIFHFPGRERVLYLTIDDAPSIATEQILEVLSKHNVPATFFVIGSWVHDPRELDEIHRAGHGLGHHMWTTKAATRLTAEEFRAGFDATAQLLSPYHPEYFRAPSGIAKSDQLSYLKTHGLTAILGTAYPLDASIDNPTLLKMLVRWLAVPGGIIIMHDGTRHGRMTARVLDELIPELKRRGYEFRQLPTSPTK